MAQKRAKTFITNQAPCFISNQATTFISIKVFRHKMNEPYRIRTAVAPEPLSRDEVKEYFERKARNHAVNPERYSARIMTR